MAIQTEPIVKIGGPATVTALRVIPFLPVENDSGIFQVFTSDVRFPTMSPVSELRLGAVPARLRTAART